MQRVEIIAVEVDVLPEVVDRSQLLEQVEERLEDSGTVHDVHAADVRREDYLGRGKY